MEIKKTNTDGHITVKPMGRLDSLTAGDFETELNQIINDEIKSLTIDLEAVDFVSSKGLRVLVGAYKKMNGKDVILDNANSSIMEVLRLSGLLKVFKINEK